MPRTIVLSAPSKQLTQIVGHPSGRWIYARGQPVWEDQDMRREEAARKGLKTTRADEVKGSGSA
jgi:hypothetical protein